MVSTTANRCFAGLVAAAVTTIAPFAIAQAVAQTSPAQPAPTGTPATKPAAPAAWANAKLLKTLQAEGAIHAAVLSADGKTLVTGGRDILQIWNLETGQAQNLNIVKSITGEASSDFPAPTIVSLAISPDGKTLVTSSTPSVTKSVSRTPPGCNTSTGFGTFGLSCGGGSTTTTTSWKQEAAVQIWDLPKREYLATLDQGGSRRLVSFSPDGKVLLEAVDRTTQFRDVANGQIFERLPDGVAGNVRCQQRIAFSPDSQRIATAYPNRGGAAAILGLYKGELSSLRTEPINPTSPSDSNLNGLLETFIYSASCFTFSRTGQKVAANLAGTVVVWELLSEQKQQRFVSKTLADLSKLSRQDRRPLLSKLLHSNQAQQAIAFSPDERVLAATDTDGTIKFWDLQTGKLLRSLTGHPASPEANRSSPPTISTIAFLDSKRFLSAGSDGKINLWSVP